MKKQILGLVLLTAFLASLMVVSAADLSLIQSLTPSGNPGTTILGTFIVNNTQYPNVNITSATLSGATGITLNTTSFTAQTQSVSFSVAVPSSQTTGTLTYNVYATYNLTNGTNITTPVSIGTASIYVNSTNTLCSNPGAYLDISDISYDVLKGFGEDDDYLYPLDEIEVSFDVENIAGTADMKNIKVKANLIDTKTGKKVMNEKDMDLSDNDFDLDSGDDTTITMTATLDPDYFKAGITEYTLYIAVTGEVDDSGEVNDGNDICALGSDSIEIRTDEQFVVLSNIIASESVCGYPMEITADLWNIGDSDIDSDEVFVQAYNKELGINKVIGIDSDLDSMDYQEITMDLDLPKEYAEKTYQIKLSIFDDERASDNDIYQTENDDEAIFNVLVPLKKCSIDTSTDAGISVSAELSADTPKAVIGEQFVVESTIKNTGTSSATYTVSVSGNEAWSEVSSIEPNTFTLASGESKKVSIYFNVDSTAKAGDKDFTIKTAYGSKTSEQKVAVTLEEGLTSSKIMQHIKANSFVYTIVLINLILLIAIIIVIVKMFGRKSDD